MGRLPKRAKLAAVYQYGRSAGGDGEIPHLVQAEARTICAVRQLARSATDPLVSAHHNDSCLGLIGMEGCRWL